MIKRGIVKEELRVDSHFRRENGSCPLMPEEVCSVNFIYPYYVNMSPILWLLAVTGLLFFKLFFIFFPDCIIITLWYYRNFCKILILNYIADYGCMYSGDSMFKLMA